jgi:cyclohexadienyl dehydratase
MSVGRARAALLCAFVICFPGASRGEKAASRLDAIIATGEIRIGSTGDYRPFSFVNASGGFEGFDIDMTAALAAALGVKPVIVRTTWPNLAKDFDADRFDLAAGGVSITLDRARKGYFSLPIMREGKTPIARCADVEKYREVADIDRPDVRVIVNPGGTNERFARDNIKRAPISVFPDNVGIFDEIEKGAADVMITDASETLYQQKLHPGALCAIHPDRPFDFAEKAYWLRRDGALKQYVDQWLHIMMETGRFATLRDKWFK